MIEAYAKQLKLPYLKKNYSTLLQQAIDLDQSFEEFLTQLLMLEIEQRQNNRIQTLIRQSKLSSKVTFDDYMDSHLEVKMKKQIKELKTLRFIDQKENLILMGNPGYK
ncbi:ATP-binding protein [Enterococcus sp. AZ196]|uniref:ATP-binding protein n=1 Tax=Enterococcus sp. AZ196 TaxID=2774659 RepID=UPI003D299F11